MHYYIECSVLGRFAPGPFCQRQTTAVKMRTGYQTTTISRDAEYLAMNALLPPGYGIPDAGSGETVRLAYQLFGRVKWAHIVRRVLVIVYLEDD